MCAAIDLDCACALIQNISCYCSSVLRGTVPGDQELNDRAVNSLPTNEGFCSHGLMVAKLIRIYMGGLI